MTLSKLLKEQQAELHSKLWKMANDLRGNMQSFEFKDYILGMLFYRYLSEKIEDLAAQALADDNLTYLEAWKDEELKEDLIAELTDILGYIIEPEYLFSTMIKAVSENSFDIEMLYNALNKINESTQGKESEDAFNHLFDDMDLTSSKLGKTPEHRSKLIAKLISSVSEIDFKGQHAEIDYLGDAYEYLIGQFSADSGKSGGEFFTPQPVSSILAKIVSNGKTKIRDAYDPTCGSGSLLLRISKEVEVSKFYGQEKTSTTFNLARMNMILHGVNYQNFDIQNGDTLEEDLHEGKKFEVIVANPPYSANWSADKKYLEDDRFSAYGKLAPKSKADFAFVQHMLHHLDDKGTMAVVLPHGVLFRGAAEGAIRKHILNQNYLDAVIGLPANIFFGTSIPTCILVFKKCRENSENVLFIDASNNYEKGKNQNILRQSDIEDIVNTYKERKDVDKFSRVVTLDEIKDNDYNLNIPRYVDTFEEEEQVDLQKVSNQMANVDTKINDLNDELEVFLKELGLWGENNE